MPWYIATIIGLIGFYFLFGTLTTIFTGVGTRKAIRSLILDSQNETSKLTLSNFQITKIEELAKKLYYYTPENTDLDYNRYLKHDSKREHDKLERELKGVMETLECYFARNGTHFNIIQTSDERVICSFSVKGVTFNKQEA